MKKGEMGFSEMTETGSPYRKLTYSESFRQLISENPGLIASFKKIHNEIRGKLESDPESIKTGDVFEENGLKITLIDPDDNLSEGYGTPGDHLEVEIGEKKFFVKTVNGFEGQSAGVQEIHSLERARDLLKDQDNVEVIDFQLGYQDREGNTYFVSKWEKGIPLDKYIEILDARTRKDGRDVKRAWTEWEKLRRRIESIRKILKPEFVDAFEHNFLYDPKTGKLLLFDIHHLKEIGNEFSAKRSRKGE